MPYKDPVALRENKRVWQQERMKDPEHRRKKNEGARARMRERMKDPEHRRKRNEAERARSRERMKDPEHRRKKNEGARARMKDPEYRRKKNLTRRSVVSKMTKSERRAVRLRYTYGITIAEFDACCSAQDGRCAICSSLLTGKINVDHDHTTGLVRGILCTNCNVGLGWYEKEGCPAAAERYLADPPFQLWVR